MSNSTTVTGKLTGYKADVETSRTSRFSRLYIVALKVGFGCLSYLMAGLSLGLVYVLSEMDYFVLSGVFRGERFFSDDGYYFAKQVVLVYGVFGFGCVLLLGPIGRQCVILWSWLLTFGYICVCIFVYLGRMSEYGVLLMRFMSVISLISHMSLCNFMFFLFDPNVTDSNSVIYRVLGFILGYFVCCPIVSFVLLRINVCVGLGFCQSDPVDSAFEMCRIVLTIFSISLISSICLTFQFVYDYLTNTDTGFVWVPSLMISNKVVAKTLFNFIDFELLCVVWLVNPIIITLVPYTTASHSQFHTLTFTHKLTFSLTLFVILLIVHKDFVQQCFRNLGKLNMAIFNIMYTDGYIQLVDKHLRETPISTTPFPNYINSCSTDTTSNTAIRKIENTVVVPGFVAYPYLEDPFDDIDNQDKYLLQSTSNLYYYIYQSDGFNPYIPNFTFQSSNHQHFSVCYNNFIHWDHVTLENFSNQCGKHILSLISSYSDRCSLNTSSPVLIYHELRFFSITDKIALEFYNFVKSLIKSSSTSISSCLKTTIKLLTADQTTSTLYYKNAVLVPNSSISDIIMKAKNLWWVVFSNSSLSDCKHVMSRSYGNYKEFFDALSEICCSFRCFCVYFFLRCNKCHRKYLESIEKFDRSDYLSSNPPVHLKKMMDSQGNHVCLCLIIALGLYPNIIKCYCYLHYMKLDVFYVSKRRFDKCTKVSSFYFGRAEGFLLVINLVFKISKKICSLRSFCTCYCTRKDDPYYQFYIATILFICHLIENMFDHLNETTGNLIQSLSALKAELDHVKFDKRDGGTSSCEVYSTSVCINVSDFQVNNTIFYKDKKYKIDFKQIEDPCLYTKICCCKNAGCGTQSNCSCQRTNGSCTCCCCTANGAGTCTNCSCDGSVKSTWKFIVGHGVSKVNSEYCLSEKFPNFWCLHKRILCISKDTAGPCGCDKIDCIKCIKGKASHYYRIVTRVNSKMIPYIFNTGILCLVSEMKIDIKVFTKMAEIIRHEKLVKTTRNIRLYEQQDIGSIEGNSVKGGETNHYSYNDAYRINTSRAHGSLKYIIIKLVLIIIIVTMTIFIRVKIETDDYKIVNEFSEEKGMITKTSISTFSASQYISPCFGKYC